MSKNTDLILPGMRVAVMGLGISGRAAVRYARKCGAEVLVSDHRPEAQFLEEEKELLAEGVLAWEAGCHTVQFLAGADLVLPGPGVPTDHPVLQELAATGIPMAGELAVVAGKLCCPVVAITGTNGKTTVTTLIGKMLSDAGKSTFVGGNIGEPLYNCLMDGKQWDIVVAEVSSFQLELAGEFAPQIGLFLNLTPDHLDRHHSMPEYLDIKKKLFVHQTSDDIAILGGDDPLCRSIAADLEGTTLFFGSRDTDNARIEPHRVSLTWQGQEEEYTLKGTSFLSIIGAKNSGAAILAGRALGISQASIQESLTGFVPLGHRVEKVATIKGVDYYNDSKATNSGAVIAALGQFDKGVILVAGGRDKGDDFRLLRPFLAARVKMVILIGEAALTIEQAIGDLVKTIRAALMEDAVRKAAKCAEAGDVVLLSPGCASFDMFQSYGHRGEMFRQAVQSLYMNGEECDG